MALAVLTAAACSANPSPKDTAQPPPTAQTTAPHTAPLPSATPEPTTQTAATDEPSLEIDTPAVSFSQSERQVLAQEAFEFNTVLAKELGPRASATDQERLAADYLAAEFAAMGYQVEIQPFTVSTLSLDDSSLSIEAAGEGAGGPEVIPIDLLSGTAEGEVSGLLTPVGLAMSGDIPEQGLEGRIALIERGAITFRQKVNRVGQAGAVGAIIYNNVPGDFQGTLGRRDADSISIPVVSISDEDGARLLEALAGSEMSATLSVVRVTSPSRNVVAEKPGPGNAVVVLGAHYDSVPGVEGANDNASGTAVLLTVGKNLAGEDLPFTLRFVPFGSEEIGLRGSRAYLDSLTEEEVGRISAMLNFDALGSGPDVRITGTSVLTGLAVRLSKESGVPVTESAGSVGSVGSTSDHATFDREGIPVIMFSAADSSRFHSPQDTLEFVQPELLGDSAFLALAMLKSPDFPGSP